MVDQLSLSPAHGMAGNLTSQVRNTARGDLSKKIDVDARSGILELKATINTMVDTLSSFSTRSRPRPANSSSSPS